MNLIILIPYIWSFIVLVTLEGVLSADNAIVLAIMVKDLDEREKKKALFYGLFGAFALRISALFFISILTNVWQIQAIGSIYLIYVGLHNLKIYQNKIDVLNRGIIRKRANLIKTIIKIELTDLAFAIDSILAAVAVAITLPKTPLPAIGGMDGAQFLLVIAGGFIGVIIMRFASLQFIEILKSHPNLEKTAFMIVVWVGIKLVFITLAHEDLQIIPHKFPHSVLFTMLFWIVLIILVVRGWTKSNKVRK